ncbi:trigger factor [Terrihabitans rhizophilus]|uniref:Trigger factor n=1 Tax=Terrihabitans rhizophilus TaxID=3092662 RepID=A0ABU4RL04_9HYPH|nr:trigger factor [Terrihabitans sp. PJ23]MDX6805502.1 trigger factor [Terrihabitans sp. PJ23]
MQVTQTLSEGLKREFRITVPAGDLDSRVATRLSDLQGKVQIKGFRPGKVPAAHLKRLYGRSVFGEVLQEVMTEANQKIVEDNKIKLAGQPKVSLPEEQAEIEGVAAGKNDLAYTVEVEVLPEITVGDLKTIKVERLVTDISDEQVDEMLARIAEQNATFEPKDGAAETGDQITIDFVGSIDGTPFEGGAGNDHPLVLGSGQFIPGFEEQLVGAKAGDEKTVTVSFPEDYRATELAGKDAAFAVTVKGIASSQNAKADDELATKLGMESLDKLKDAVREQIGNQQKQASRQKLKRALLDALDSTHSFDLPPSLVEQEFAGIWTQVEREIAQGGDAAKEGKSEDELKAEYRTIAERRVRLGLLLAEIGEKADIQVTNDEVTRAVVERARQFPGQEQQVWEFYQKTPEALAELRAPIFEEKVIDHIVELADVSDKTVTREELFADAESEEV